VIINGYFSVAISGYSINDYWWLLMDILLVSILAILLIAIGGYFKLCCHRLLVFILL